MEADFEYTKGVMVRCGEGRQEGTTYNCRPLFRPLSSYSRKIMCDSTKDRSGHFGLNMSVPFCNIKIEIVNNQPSVSTKRLLDDSCLDEAYTTPLKKHFDLSSSPDPACVLGSGSSVTENGPVPKKPRTSKQLNPGGRSPVKKGGGGMSFDPVLGGDKAGLSHSDTRPGATSAALSLPCPQSPAAPSAQNSVDLAHAFDFDIEEILSLSPIGSDGDNSEGIEAFIESCQSYYENSLNEPDAGVAQQNLKWGGGQGGDEDEESKDWEAFRDEGYFSKSYCKALGKLGRGASQGTEVFEVTPLQLTCTSSPVVKSRELSNQEQVSFAGGEQNSPSPTDEPVVCRNLLLSLEEVSHPLPGPPLADTAGGLRGSDRGEDQAFVIGSPLHDSSIKCRSISVKPVPAREGPRVTEDQRTPVRERLGSFVEECAAPKTTFNSTVLPPPQVRSVVVVPLKRTDVSDGRNHSQHTHIKREAARPASRPVVFDREEDWQRQKRIYVDTVCNHMAENPGGAEGVMTELLNLMNSVANQGAGDGDKGWQHPSDLTRRNYHKRAGKPRVSLDEWRRLQDLRFQRRFAGVPHKFQRSPVP